ncbi:hypothetical protein K474DRAFT_1676667 [Panus rudis PR-1116 ss-1]|nr:hypothetical protein K474DRAFT_1676667 [Panus rudis PR-1116 ss-1]
MTSSTTSSGALTLTFPKKDDYHVAGDAVVGEVELDFPQNQEDHIEEIHIKLKGSIHTGDQSETLEKRELVRQRISLWQKGTAYPAPGEHILRLPFAFNLPPNLPPSFKYHTVNGEGVVSYVLEVIGERSGSLSSNRRITCPVRVVPHDPVGAYHRQCMQQGWSGSWSSYREEARVRKHPWAGQATISVEFQVPAMTVIPLSTPIPFTVTLRTLSAPTTRKEDKSKDSIWPLPPRKAKDVELWLNRHVYLPAPGIDESQDHISLGGLGHSHPHSPTSSNSSSASSSEDESEKSGHVEILHCEPEWVPYNDAMGKGAWKAEAIIRSAFVVNSTPSFADHAITLTHNLKLRAKFPGVRKRLEICLPVQIGSGMMISNSTVVDAPPRFNAAPDYSITDILPPYSAVASTVASTVASPVTSRTTSPSPDDMQKRVLAMATHPSGLVPGYRHVQEFSPIPDTYETDSDGNIEEETFYVTLDLGTVEPTLVPKTSEYRLIGLDTPTPFLQLSGAIFKGEHHRLLGTEIIFTDAKDDAPSAPRSRPLVPFTTTEQRIRFREVELKPKNADNNLKEKEGNSRVSRQSTNIRILETNPEEFEPGSSTGRRVKGRGRGRGRGRGSGRGKATATSSTTHSSNPNKGKGKEKATSEDTHPQPEIPDDLTRDPGPSDDIPIDPALFEPSYSMTPQPTYTFTGGQTHPEVEGGNQVSPPAEAGPSGHS